MTGALRILRAGPGVSVQDGGRPGWLAQGLSRGGAMDPLALAEGAALLGQSAQLAALEIAGSFVSVQPDRDLRIAFAGAPMRASLEGQPLTWNASHMLPKDGRLDIAAVGGGYGYLHVGGGIDIPLRLGSRAAHLAAGLGGMAAAGDHLPLGTDQGTRTGLRLIPAPRFDGGPVRMVPGPQTALFTADEVARFQATVFAKDARGNRMGQRLVQDGPGFGSDAGLTILSETVIPGDIQITGDGTPFVLLAECQTTGGYPRIGTVLPCDLPRLVHAPAGAALRFSMVTLDEGAALERAEAARRDALAGALLPLIRDPRDMPDLLRYQLISGVTAGDDLEGG